MILAIETSSPVCSVALMGSNQKILSRSIYANTQHSEHLFSMIDSLLCDAACSRVDIKTVVSGVGPGSFTGVRIALSVAHAFSLALNIPLIGVDSLKNLAYLALSMQIGREDHVVVWSLIDARLDQLYVACYCFQHASSKIMTVLVAPVLVSLDEWQHLNEQYVADIYVGSGISVIQKNGFVLSDTNTSRSILSYPECEPLAEFALEYLKNNEAFCAGDVVIQNLDVKLLSPLYLREQVAKTEQQRLADKKQL